MADNRAGRDKQAQDADRRQRERELAEELVRGGEPEPPVPEEEVAAVEGELAALSFPATGADIVATVGEHTVESNEGRYPIEALLPETSVETFASPEEVRARIERPTVATAMKRVMEAIDTLRYAELSQSQRTAYEKTFRALKAIDADDDDEGIDAIAEWIVERIHDKQKLPGSRDVRREAAKYCRRNGYTVRDDDWLGV
jgi:hypothetical protein